MAGRMRCDRWTGEGKGIIESISDPSIHLDSPSQHIGPRGQRNFSRVPVWSRLVLLPAFVWPSINFTPRHYPVVTRWITLQGVHSLHPEPEEQVIAVCTAVNITFNLRPPLCPSPSPSCQTLNDLCNHTTPLQPPLILHTITTLIQEPPLRKETSILLSIKSPLSFTTQVCVDLLFPNDRSTNVQYYPSSSNASSLDGPSGLLPSLPVWSAVRNRPRPVNYPSSAQGLCPARRFPSYPDVRGRQGILVLP